VEVAIGRLLHNTNQNVDAAENALRAIMEKVMHPILFSGPECAGERITIEADLRAESARVGADVGCGSQPHRAG
jgi:ATP-dependent protease HslVU (ClpYQ) ATPase subunit